MSRVRHQDPPRQTALATSARAICRLVTERPDAIGRSVPGLARGSPGMDGPAYGIRDVLLVGRGDRASVFQRYR